MKVRIYVEGGGDSKELRIRCKRAFGKLLEKARAGKPQPAVVAHGGRDQTFDAFQTAHHNAAPDEIVVLLVDSEEPVHHSPWRHLLERDGWKAPEGADDEQCHLMVACMETWILADRETLRKVFRDCLTENALLPLGDLEKRTRDEVQQSLARATQRCPEDRRYTKGRRSFQVVEALEPGPLRSLHYFARLVEMLDRRL